MYLHFFDIDIQAKVPFINIEYSPNEYVSLVFLLLNIYFVFRISLEWYRSEHDSKKEIFNKIDFIVSLTIAIFAIVAIVFKITQVYWMWSFPVVPLILILIVGEFTAATTALYIQNLVYIRTKKEAALLGASRIPLAVLGGLIFIPVNVLILYFTSYVINEYASNIVKLHWATIILIPFVIHFLGLIIYFIFPNKEMRKFLQETFDAYDRSCELKYGKKENTKCDLTRKLDDNEYHAIVEDLTNGQNPDAPIAEGGWTFLIFAAAQGDYRLAKLLLEYGADVNSKNTMGRTALFFACKYGYEDIVKLLIDENAIINDDADSCIYEVPLIEATKNGHQNIVELLIKHNVNIFQEDCDGKTALLYAEENSYGEIAKILRKTANKTQEPI